MSTIEIIIYSCLSFGSLSLALGYIIKCRTNDTINDANAIKPSLSDIERSVELVIQQEIIAAL
jgi:hypothetical protein